MRLIFLALVTFAHICWADIYRYQDADGVTHYTDQAADNATLIPPPQKTYRYKHRVKRVYDGDTITLENGDRIRLLGINTPEIDSRHRHGEQGGETAKQWLQTELKQGDVFIEYDEQRKDKYGRSLAHLFLPSGKHLNLELVREGLATCTIIPPNLRYSDAFIAAEKEAQKDNVGIWAMRAYQAVPVSEFSANKKLSGWQRFLATPTELRETRKYMRLVLTDHVDIRIPKDNISLFPELSSYLGKSLEIRGWASRSKSDYSILIRHPSAIVSLK